MHYLLTCHGTMLYYDQEARSLRHGAVQNVPHNLRLLPGGGRPILEFRSGKGGTVGINRTRNGRLGYDPAARPEAGGISFDAIPTSGRRVAMRACGLFLCAEPDGGVALNRIVLGPWETFLRLDQKELEALLLLTTERWFCVGRRKLVSPGLHPAFSCRIADLDLGLEDLLGRLAAEPSPERQFHVVFDGWKVERLLLYRPLIYFAAFGDKKIFDCLSLAVRSVLEVGGYTGRIALLSNISEAELHDLVPAEVHRFVDLYYVPASDRLDFTLARYKIVDFNGFKQFQPLLYMDTDIICNANIDDLLTDVVQARGVCFSNELELHHPGDFYGTSLFRQDPIASIQASCGFTSGIIGLPNHYAFPMFSRVIETAYSYAASAGNRNALAFLDQPIANYVFHKVGDFDSAVLTGRIENLLGGFGRADQLLERRGLVHFCGGIGNAEPKFTAMQRYLDILRQLDARGGSPSAASGAERGHALAAR